MYLSVIDSWETHQKHTMHKRQFLQYMILGRSIFIFRKNILLSFNIHKNQLKIDQRYKPDASNCKTAQRKHRGNTKTSIYAMIL